MKKLLTLFVSVAVLIGWTISASAAVMITFDESGISLENLITNQCASSGVTWIADPFQAGSTVANQVINGTGDYFNNTFDTYGQILQYNSKPADGYILLNSYADFLSFQYRRPGSSGDISVALFDYDPGTGTSLPVNTFDFKWSPNADPYHISNWATFTYNGEEGNFNLIRMFSNNKFVIDNLAVNAVPLPASLWLLVSGLLPLVWRRIRK
jgi:hypothetical protein